MTNLIFHYGITDTFDLGAKCLHVFGALQGPCHLAPLRQFNEILGDFV